MLSFRHKPMTPGRVGLCLIGGAAAAFLFHVPGIPIVLRDLIAHITAIPIFMAGFAFGLWGAALTGLVAAAATAALLPQQWILIYGLFFVMPILIMVGRCLLPSRDPLAERGFKPFGPVLLELLALYIGVTAVIALMWSGGAGQMILDTHAFLGRWMREVGLHDVMVVIVRLINASITDQMAEDGAELGYLLYAIGAPAILTMALVVLGMFNARLAMAWLPARHRLRPSLDMVDIWVPRWLLPLLLAACVVVLVLPIRSTLWYVGLNATIALTLPLMMAGIALFHLAVADLPGRRVLLILFYLVTLTLWPLVLVILVGAFDSVLPLRPRLRRAATRRAERMAAVSA